MASCPVETQQVHLGGKSRQARKHSETERLPKAEAEMARGPPHPASLKPTNPCQTFLSLALPSLFLEVGLLQGLSSLSMCDMLGLFLGCRRDAGTLSLAWGSPLWAATGAGVSAPPQGNVVQVSVQGGDTSS